MKTKILQFLHSKKFVRIVCALCAMLPVLLFGLYAIPKNYSKVTASAAEAGDFVIPPYSMVSIKEGPYAPVTISAYDLGLEGSAVSTDGQGNRTFGYRVGFFFDSALTLPAAASYSYGSGSYTLVPFIQCFDDGPGGTPTTSNFAVNLLTLNCYSSASTNRLPVTLSAPHSLTGGLGSSPPFSDPSGDLPSFDDSSYFTMTYAYVNCSNRTLYTSPAASLLLGAYCKVTVSSSGGGGYTAEQVEQARSEGYVAGYNKGQSDQLVNPLSYFITPVQTFLDTKLFGVVSFGMVLNIVLFVLIATIFIKMFAGG